MDVNKIRIQVNRVSNNHYHQRANQTLFVATDTASSDDRDDVVTDPRLIWHICVSRVAIVVVMHLMSKK
jgi:hypothetical protein